MATAFVHATQVNMATNSPFYTSALRRELAVRNRHHARGRLHVESFGGDPVIVYAPHDELHGNFFDAAYRAIMAHSDWHKRFNKIHAQARSLPKPIVDPSRKWRELDSAMSSDALLMNIMCTPGVAESPDIKRTLGIDSDQAPSFGFRARVPLTKNLFDRTEVDMRWSGLLVEAKLTESDFQTCKAHVAESYRDFDAVFDRDLLPRVPIVIGRRKKAVEFPEDFSQEYEQIVPVNLPFNGSRPIDRILPPTVEPGYASYQLIRNVLAAYAHGVSFCVMQDARRPDLRDAWFEVMAAVRNADLRSRLKVLTWQEFAVMLPSDLQQFLDLKYGIVPPGATPSDPEHSSV